MLCVFVQSLQLHDGVFCLFLYLPAIAQPGPSTLSLFTNLLLSTYYLRVIRNVIASEKQLVQLELITSFTVFPLHFALVSFIAFPFCCVFYLFVSHTHPRNTHMHTLCGQLLVDSHPIYPSTRTSIRFTHCCCCCCC